MQQLNQYLDRVYVINLPERTDRRRQILGELARLGFAPGDPRVEFPFAPKPDDAHGFPSRAVYGNYLSHLSILQDAAAKQYARILILEDDAMFSRRMLRSQREWVAELSARRWDLCFFGHSLVDEIADQPDGLVESTAGFMWMHCFMVNASVFQSLIGYLQLSMELPVGDPRGGKMYIDGAYNHFRVQHDVVSLVAKPAVSRQRGSPSSIAAGNWFDKVSPLAPVLRGLRWGRDWLWRLRN